MADSDIQFLGNWSSQQATSNGAFVSAIVLIPMDGSPSRTFSRIQTSLVNIGRISAQEALGKTTSVPPPDETAGFTNPVMSRNHAKITFADSGSAFIIDTNSHHGTWVCRPTSIKPKVRLASESPYMLLDGDKITFGKEVNKNGIIHQPLTVSVKLLRANSHTSSPVAVVGPHTSNASPKPRNRFGLGRSSDSESSDNEGTGDKHSSSPDVIRVELPFKASRIGGTNSSESESRILSLDSPSPKSSSSITHSPSNVHKRSTSPRHSPERRPFKSVEISPPPTLAPCLYSPDLQPPGLELSGMGSQTDNSAPTPGILSLTPALPPWRRAGALLSASNLLDASTGPSEPQRQIGRLLSPLWMRNVRAEPGGDYGGGAVQSRGMNILSGVGLFSRFRGRSEEATREQTHQRHGSDGELHEATVVPVDQDGPPVKSSHETLSARLNEIETELAAVQETTRALKNNTPLEEITTLKSTLAALETVVAALRTDMTTVQDDVSGANVDTGALRVDLTTLRTGYKAGIADIQERVGTQATSLRSDIDKLRAEVSTFPRSVEIVTQDVSACMREYNGVRDEVVVLQKDSAKLQGNLERLDLMARKVSDDLQGLDETIMRRVREEILQASSSNAAEQSPSPGGKRKRAHDEGFGSESSTSALAASEPRPSKRLRTVAAASVLGAFGAYIGLAYLQL